jgi:Flp pilus assembly protein TadG
MKRLFSNFRDCEDGQAVVELALAIPVLLVVVLGIADFGRAVNYWNNDTHMANLAARYAAVGALPTTEQDKTCGGKTTVTAYVECEAGIDSAELKNGSGESTGAKPIKVCVSIPEEKTGGQVTVRVTTRYNWLPLPKVLGGQYPKFAESELTGSATMRIEQVTASTPGFKTTTGTCS